MWGYNPKKIYARFARNRLIFVPLLLKLWRRPCSLDAFCPRLLLPITYKQLTQILEMFDDEKAVSAVLFNYIKWHFITNAFGCLIRIPANADLCKDFALL